MDRVRKATLVFPLFVISVLAGVVGCIANPVMIPERMQLVSAGHTGCLPDDNELSNISDEMWNATCKGKVYLCSAVGSAGSNAVSASCAPVAN